jgi:hypothetical protein
VARKFDKITPGKITIGLPENLLTDKGEDTDEWALQMDTFRWFLQFDLTAHHTIQQQ